MLSSRLYKALLVVSAIAWPAMAMAGPCSDDIAQLTRQLDAKPGLGAPTSGVVAGSAPAGQMAPAQKAGSTVASDRAQPGGASRLGGGSPGTVGGVSGTAAGAKDAVASGQVATSDQDVRNQSVGKPTAAQAAASGNAGGGDDERASQAKMSLQTATDLNAKGDASCKAAVQKTRDLMGKA